jgi:formate-dependent nitrite reductase membrane component NrfD
MSVKPYDFMVKETPARDWSEGMGAMIGVAMFLGGVAGGLYLTALYFNNVWGMLVAWIFAMGMGLFDMAHLSKPMRFFRIAARPGSSWISRGFIFVILFIGAAGLQLLINLLTGNPSEPSAAEMFFRVVAGILGFGVAIYSGFVIGVVNGVKFWNSGIMPLIYVLAGLAGGAAVMLAIGSFTGLSSFSSIQTFVRIALIAYAVAIALHLWVSAYSSPTAKHSAAELVKGELAGIFWVIVVLVGIVVPLVFTFVGNENSSVLYILSAVMVLIGSLALRYCILRAGRYTPLLPAD